MADLDPNRIWQTAIKLAREDFAVFVELAFSVLHDEPYLRNWHVNAIAHYLTLLASGEVKRLLITMPPRTMKSFIGSVCYPAWLLGRNPGEKIICASYSQKLSEDFSYKMRTLMLSELFRAIFPDCHLDPKKQSLDAIFTTRGGYRISTSTGGTLTGRGANIIIIDDAINAQDAHSEVVRENAWKWFCTTALSRLNNQKTGRFLVIAQRLHAEDLPGQLVAAGGWCELCLPLIADRDMEVAISQESNLTRQAGNILHEAMFGEEVIARLRTDMGERDFEAQYNQRPLPPGGALFKLEWLQRYDEPPKPPQTQAFVQSWDTAYDIEDHHDYSVCTTWALCGKRYYLLDVYRERLEFADLEKAIYAQRKKWKANLVIVEKAGSGISLAQNIRRGNKNHWLKVLSPVGSKQDRASQQTPKFERGEIFVPTEAPWLKVFEDEYVSFPHGKHDDQIDSVTQFLAAVDTGRILHLVDLARRR